MNREIPENVYNAVNVLSDNNIGHMRQNIGHMRQNIGHMRQNIGHMRQLT